MNSDNISGGGYLRKALQKISINVFDVDMSRTNTSPYTFSATEQPEGLIFSNIIFGDDGYLVEFSAKDSEIELDIDPGDDVFQNLTTVYGLDYYRNTMGQATPLAESLQYHPINEPLIATINCMLSGPIEDWWLCGTWHSV